ncbi:P-loop containing nucleoside triphosphate hydrolase protein [Russula earlei]|uniref:P-loop containing nucleoside triphosphate hydrolase protein n=1 Tax=Russula earlei TaxID=71964 RepID=A0ACC0UCF3_9AGAM|nr:P-loop containing nucleoside triphosphate hydrolase protein [Russula earlei]
MSSSALQRRSSRTSVLGKRSHPSRVDVAPSPASIKSLSRDLLDDNDDVSVIDLSPCAKRPRTSLITSDRHGNKENIPPSLVDPPDEPSRGLRRSSTEFITPTRPRTTLRRHASTSNIAPPDTLATSMPYLGLQTPPQTPSTSLPLHIRTRALLRATCNTSHEIAGRIHEEQVIRNFITEFFNSGPVSDVTRPVLYISGSPGCGKTALVNSILATFEVELLKNNVNLVLLNCMALNGLEAVWERLVEELGPLDKRRGKTRHYEIVEKLLSSRTSKCILVLDEVDHVAVSSQTLASLFTLAHKHSSTLRIIGIANTHTLTSSASTLSLDSVIGVSTVHFTPYDHEQLLSILHSRLKPLTSLDSPSTEATVQRFLPLSTLTLLSRKIAAQTGDVRCLFEVLRRAIDLAVTQPPASDKDTPPVTPSHILAALNAYAPAFKACNVRNLGLHARLALLALVVACRRTEASLPLLTPAQGCPPWSPVKRSNSSPTLPPTQAGIQVSQLHVFYVAMLTRHGSDAFTPVSRSEFGDLAGVLETIGLITLSALLTGRKVARTTSFSGRGAKSLAGAQQDRSVALMEGVRLDEVLRGLGIGAEAKDICEEEVEGIWKRELARIRKEARAQRPGAQTDIGFDDATKD